MASPARSAPDHLAYLGEAAARVHSVEPLQLLRGAEARAPQLPRIGTARLPAQNIVDLRQVPSLGFPASSLETITRRDERTVVEGYWLGLTGPMGPLPLHLSEFAAYERRYSRQQPFGGFLDVIAGRMLQLFYRCWANASPAASSDRPDEDHFSDRVAALTGAEDAVPDAAAFPRRARLRYAALFASARSATAIQDALIDLMRTPVRIVENIGRWADIEPEERSRLGRGFAQLGESAVIGGRVRTVSDAFRVVLTVASHQDLVELMPGGRRYALLVEALDAFTPSHLEWEVELAVAAPAIRPTRLSGHARLGWSSWVGAAPPGTVRADARLGRSARRLAGMERTR